MCLELESNDGSMFLEVHCSYLMLTHLSFLRSESFKLVAAYSCGDSQDNLVASQLAGTFRQVKKRISITRTAEKLPNMHVH